MAMGYHAEVYGDAQELYSYAPVDGVVLARAEMLEGGVTEIVEGLTAAGRWLPVIAASTHPTVEDAVQAIKQGALDYLPLPANPHALATAIENVAAEAQSHRDRRARHVHAKAQLAKLSPREFEVLDKLSQGLSNKEIARIMGISHRTVEIHRMNALIKIGARHSAEAVRLRIEGAAFAEAN